MQSLQGLDRKLRARARPHLKALIMGQVRGNVLVSCAYRDAHVGECCMVMDCSVSRDSMGRVELRHQRVCARWQKLTPAKQSQVALRADARATKRKGSMMGECIARPCAAPAGAPEGAAEMGGNTPSLASGNAGTSKPTMSRRMPSVESCVVVQVHWKEHAMACAR